MKPPPYLPIRLLMKTPHSTNSLPNLKRLLFFAIVFLLGVGRSHATTILYVNKNAPANSLKNGSSWANAYSELRDAMTNSAVGAATAANTVEIWVAKGTYTPTSGTNRLACFPLKSHIRILGGFKGTETSDSQRLFFGYP